MPTLQEKENGSKILKWKITKTKMKMKTPQKKEFRNIGQGQCAYEREREVQRMTAGDQKGESGCKLNPQITSKGVHSP